MSAITLGQRLTPCNFVSKMAWSFVDRILTHANDICLLLNASVNAYRRLDPHFEAPNQIKASPIDRGSSADLQGNVP